MTFFLANENDCVVAFNASTSSSLPSPIVESNVLEPPKVVFVLSFGEVAGPLFNFFKTRLRVIPGAALPTILHVMLLKLN